MASARDASTMADAVDSRPPPKDLSYHFSRNAKSRQASAIKKFYKYFSIPGIGQLAGGLPNNYYFPYDTLEAKVARPNRWEPTPNDPIDPPPDNDDLPISKLSIKDKSIKNLSSPLNQPQDGITVPHTTHEPNPIKKIDLSTALQYGTAQGYPPLYYFIRELTQTHLHPNCPYKDGPEVILTCGNTDGFSKVLQLLTNEWSEEKDWIRDRDALLVEKYAYMNAVQTARPRGMNIVPVAIDDEGMCAEGKGGLKEVLENWDLSKGRKPRVMYTVTMGQNPTSGVLSLQRRRDIYALCCKHDIIIVEDDPYWYLQYPSSTSNNTLTTRDPANTSFNPEVKMFANGEPMPEGWKSSGFDFLDSLCPSSLSIDTEGRVVRLDTFSKTVAPGCRLGWISAQPAFIERLQRLTETSTQQPSGFVQSMIAELLLGPDHDGLDMNKHKSKDGRGGLPSGEGWKAAGWIRWLEGLRGNYEKRMNQMCSILYEGRHLVKTGRRNSIAEDADEWSVVEKTEIYSFTNPVGGMFLWLEVHFETHPLYRTYQKANEMERFSKALWLYWTTKPYKVLVSPGTLFSATEEIKEREGWRFFRLCFAAINEDELAGVSERLRDGIMAFWAIKDKKVIEKLLKDDEEDEASVMGEEEDVVNVAQGAWGC